MLTISEAQMAAFEAKAAGDEEVSFVQWWLGRSGFFGVRDQQSLRAIYRRHKPEADFAGLDDETEVFPFIAGRALIPGCEGQVYIALLDLVCDDDCDEAFRLSRIAGWAGRQQAQ
jgi:hypothetical protein